MAAYLLTQDREILAKSLPIDSGDSNLVHLLICYTWCQAPVLKKGSARVPRAGDRVLAIANFPWRFVNTRATATTKDCFGATPKQHARRMRYPETPCVAYQLARL